MALFTSIEAFLQDNQLQVGRILALDVGDKYIGIAVSDSLQMIASPFKLYERKSYQKDCEEIKNLIAKENVKLLIIGLPLNLSGEIGTQGQKTITFAEKITPKITVPIIFWDERFSSQAVEKMMLSFDTSRKKRGELIDKLSATYILQGVLDYLSKKKQS